MKTKTANRNPAAPGGTPGEVLRKIFMEPLGLSAYRVAKDIEITPIALSQILRGQRGISASVALRLGIYFGVEPDFWLGLQAHHDLAEEARSKRRWSVTRCAALNGRTFALKETKHNGVRNWQVLMVKTRGNGIAGANGKKEPRRRGGDPRGLSEGPRWRRMSA